MSEARQRAYLDALEIPVWVRKELAAQVPEFVSPPLKLGPGSGPVLLVCSRVDEPATRLAADIARSLSTEPVWAWPGPDADSAQADVIVNDHLFTTVIVFGASLETQLFNGAVPETLGPARLLIAPGLDELVTSPQSRNRLWKLLSQSHLTAYAKAPSL